MCFGLLYFLEHKEYIIIDVLKCLSSNSVICVIYCSIWIDIPPQYGLFAVLPVW